MSSRLLGTAAAMLALVLVAPAATAQSVPEPQVICVADSSPVESLVGFYGTRPHSCNFHKRGQPAAYAYMIEMRQIHWIHWGSGVAVGRGKSLANMAGPVFTKVRLSAPATICGHRIFTVAKFKFSQGGFGNGLPLDRRFSSCQ